MADAVQVVGTSKAEYSIWRVIMASSVGTMIEWYDFYIFGSLTLILALRFYPQGNDKFAYLAYLVTLSIMGFSTFAIGLLPTFKTAGWFAPIVLLLIRVLQGLALGGEYGGAAGYVGEKLPDSRRGFFNSFLQSTAT